MIIEITADVYKNVFDEDHEQYPYIFDNIRASNQQDHANVNSCVETMYNERNKNLYSSHKNVTNIAGLRLGCGIITESTLMEKNKKLLLDTTKKKILFK